MNTSVMASVARQRRESIFQINPNRPAKANFIITDIFTNIDQVSKDAYTSSTTSSFKLFLKSHHVLNPTIIFALILLGISTSIFSFLMEFAIQELQELRIFLFNSSDNQILRLGIWVFSSIFLLELACFASSWLTTDAQGSGIPEMKAVLSGVKLKNFMSFRTLSAKALAVVLAIAGGLSIGKEGPFVHISGILARNISKLPGLSHIHSNLTLRNQFLAASVAAGISSIFQSPIGAVIYSIEVTSTYYIVNNMWRAAFCSIWCAIGIISLRTFGLLNIIKTTDFPTISLDLEIFPFILLGTLCGLLGALFINISSRLISLREQNIYPLLFGRFRYTLLIASVIALCTYQTTYTMLNDQQVINDMFQSDFSTNGWDYYNKGFSFAVFTVLKLIITILSLSTHIPSGTLYPLFTAGAVFGRLFEYLCGFIFSTTNGGVYAAVAAASLVAGTTHTISVAVIVFEITGQIDYFLPMIVSVLIASTVSSSFTLSIYDALLEIKGLPYLPSLKPLQMHGRSAKDIMDYSFPQLHTESTLQDLVSSIEECQLTYNKIPVVDLNGNLSFEISLDNAKKYIIKICEENKIQLSSLGLGQVEVIVKKAKRKARDSMAEYDFGTIAVASETCEELKQLLNSKININDTDLEIDDSPFVITQSTQLAKIHFLFIMLGLHQVYVTRKALLVGVITRESFTKSRTKN